jgi:hypothetical protein
MITKADVLNYVQARYTEEKERFKHFEEKCGKLLNSLTIVIAAFCGITGFKSSTLFSPQTMFQWIVLILCCFAFFALACAWGHLLLALKIGVSPIAAKSRENAEYLMSADPQDAFEQMFACYVDATQELESVIETKSKNLELAYGELILGASLVVVFIFLSIIMEVFK